MQPCVRAERLSDHGARHRPSRRVTMIAFAVASIALSSLPVAATRAAAASTGPATSTAPATSSMQGVVIVRVAEGDLRIGDRIVGGYGPQTDTGSGSAPTRVEIADPIDWSTFEIEGLPRGDHGVRVIREGTRLDIDLDDEVEGLVIRPVLDPEVLETVALDLYSAALKARDEDRGAEAAERFAELAEIFDAKRPRISAWARLEALESLPRARGTVPSIESARRAAESLPTADRLRFKTELADVLDRHGDRHGALTMLETILEGFADVEAADLSRARCQFRLGRMQRRVGEPRKARPILEQALETESRLAPRSLAAARTWNELGAVDLAGGALEAAEEGFLRAFEIRRIRRPEGAETALSLNNLGLVAEYGDRLDDAEAYYRNALALQEIDGIETVDAAGTLNNIGIVASKRGDLETAEHLFTRSLEIKERHGIGPEDLGDQLNNVGVVNQQRGDLATAEHYYRRALEARSGVNPEGHKTASSYSNLGWVIALRGDLRTGEMLLLRAAALKEKQTPGGLPVASTLHKLGEIALIRQDPESAEGYLMRAESIHARHAAVSLARARTLRMLGEVALARGELATAKTFMERSFALVEEAAPESIDLAVGHYLLGRLALRADDLDGAADHGRRAIEICQKTAPHTMIAASSHRLLGDTAARRDRDAIAESSYRRSIEVARKWDLHGLEAEASLGLARVLRRGGKPTDAALAYEQAISLREHRRRLLGGGDLARARYGDAIIDASQEYVDLLIELGRPEEAFDVLERDRARSLRDLLADRDLVHRELPEALDRERRRLDTEYDRLLAEVARWSGGADAEASLGTRLSDLRRKRAEIRTRIRATAPRLAALRHGQALDVAAIQELLDPGTLMLAYAVGEARVHLFAIRGDATPMPVAERFRAITLAVEAKPLDDLVDAYRRAVASSRPGMPSPISSADVDRLGRRLFALLVAPVSDLVAESDRLLIIPDGPLDRLPFGALALDHDGRGRDGRDRDLRDRYLIEWKPLVSAWSATVLNQLRSKGSGSEGARAAPSFDLVGIGNPRLASQDDNANALARFTDSIAELPALGPLPGSRDELRAVAAAYDPERVRLLTGDAATESALRSDIERARVVHFATHGLVDTRSPLDSALVLSHPAQVTADGGNGLLQAWEIFEGLDLEAQLVVLSACDSGLGQTFGGEGLYGLVRAFHYAGAPSVVASLWPVIDASAGALMERFHAAIAAGRTIDDALRHAQIALIRGEAGDPGRHPFAWAGFQLYGDWKALSSLSTGAPISNP